MVQIELPQDIDSNGRPHQAYPEPAEANDRSEVPNAGAPIPEPEEKPTIKRSFRAFFDVLSSSGSQIKAG